MTRVRRHQLGTPRCHPQDRSLLSVLHGNKGHGEGCESWVDWYSQVICDLEALEKLADVDTIDEASSHPYVTRPRTAFQQSKYFRFFSAFPKPHILPFDHVYPSSKALKRPPRTAIAT